MSYALAFSYRLNKSGDERIRMVSCGSMKHDLTACGWYEEGGVINTQPTGDGDHHNSDLPPFWREIVRCGVNVP